MLIDELGRSGDVLASSAPVIVAKVIPVALAADDVVHHRRAVRADSALINRRAQVTARSVGVVRVTFTRGENGARLAPCRFIHNGGPVSAASDFAAMHSKASVSRTGEENLYAVVCP